MISKERKVYIKNVLIADDSPATLVLFVQALNTHPLINAVSANDGADALEKLDAHPSAYSCIITDYSMPKMDGMKLLRCVRNDARFSSLPVIVLSGEADDELLVQRAKDLGAFAVVKKGERQSLDEMMAEVLKALKL